MPCYELKIALRGASQAQPVVRAWLDADVEAGLHSELELPLCQRADVEWSAVFVIGRRRTFLYRVGVVADPGAVWAISIVERGPRTRELLNDSDSMVARKHWLLGTCTAP